MKRTIIFSFVLLLLAGLVGGFAYFQFVMKPAVIKSAMAKSVAPPVTISSTVAKGEQWVPKIAAIGTFAAVQGIDVAPQVGGLVRAIHFDSGQQVEAGQLLVELDDFVEQADLKSNIAQLKKSELDLQRQRELLSRGNTPQSNYDSALASRDTAAAAVERTKAQIAQKAIKAPFRGRLGIRKASLGQYVSPGTALVTLQRLDPIFVDFPVPEQHLDVLRAGQTVEVSVDAFPGETFKGTVQLSGFVNVVIFWRRVRLPRAAGNVNGNLNERIVNSLAVCRQLKACLMFAVRARCRQRKRNVRGRAGRHLSRAVCKRRAFPRRVNKRRTACQRHVGRNKAVRRPHYCSRICKSGREHYRTPGLHR